MKMKFVQVRLLVFASALLVFSLYACEKSEEHSNPTLRSKEYVLNEVNGSGVNGKITITENADSSFNVWVAVNNSVKDTVHILHIHNGSISSPGNIAIPLTPFTGTGAAAESKTMNIKQAVLPDSTTVHLTYNGILNYTGYLDVHYSASKVDSLIGQGNIGSN